MWPSQYPEYAPHEVHKKTYDYVIVGGGTAGCVLASRLSEDPEVTVLVLERGYVKDNAVSRMPLLSQNMFLGDTLQVQSTRWSEPIPEANGRRTRLWTSEGLGGATRLNAMLLTRGCRADYIGWSKELGLHDWGWEQVEPYFRDIENAVDRPAMTRGHAGPLESRAIKLPFRWVPYIDKAAEEVGIPISADCNDPNGPAMGFFHFEATIDKSGRRISAFKAFLNKEIARERRHRLSVCTGAVVSRLELDVTAGKVSGVHFQSSHRSTNANQFFVKARREVILCAGAICSAQILLLSGVGPRAPESSPAPDLKIPIVKELPAVGTRFSDHYSFPIMMEVPKKESFHVLESLWGLWHILIWFLFGKGLMSVTSMPSAFYIRTGAIDAKTMSIRAREQEGSDNLDNSLPANIPDVEIMVMPSNGLERHVPGHSLLTLYPTLIQPHATGSVELKSRDPCDNPRIIHPMLLDKRDREAARLAVRFTMRLAAAFQDSGYPYPASFAFAPGNRPDLLSHWEKSGDVAAATHQPSSVALPGENATEATEYSRQQPKTWENVTDEEIDDYIRRVSHTSLHFSCTCPMSNDEKSGVVDQRLRVYGFQNLRIADASVFPRVPSSHTMLPVMMIAERCAGFIKEAWGEPKSHSSELS